MGSMTSTTCFEREIEMREQFNGKRLMPYEIQNIANDHMATLRRAAERMKARPEKTDVPKGEANLPPMTFHGELA